MQVSPFRQELTDKIRQQIKPVSDVFDDLDEATPITCEEIKAVLAAGGKLIDVRSPKDYNKAKIHNSMNVPLVHVMRTSQSWDKTLPVLVYCSNGQQAGLAKGKLESTGFKHVTNIGYPSLYGSCS